MTPQLLLYLRTSSKQIISLDVRHWARRLDYPSLPDACALLLLLAERREFRNVFYYRLRTGNLFPRLLLPVALDRAYVALLQRLNSPWRRFDRAGGRLAATWGAGWWAWGTKAG